MPCELITGNDTRLQDVGTHSVYNLTLYSLPVCTPHNHNYKYDDGQGQVNIGQIFYITWHMLHLNNMTLNAKHNNRGLFLHLMATDIRSDYTLGHST